MLEVTFSLDVAYLIEDGLLMYIVKGLKLSLLFQVNVNVARSTFLFNAWNRAKKKKKKKKKKLRTAFIFRKDVFYAWRYILNEKKNWHVIDNNLSETICLFCFYALFSNIYCKTNFTTKNGSYLCNFYTKLCFQKCLLENIFFFFFFFFFAFLHWL